MLLLLIVVVASVEVGKTVVVFVASVEVCKTVVEFVASVEVDETVETVEDLLLHLQKIFDNLFLYKSRKSL